MIDVCERILRLDSRLLLAAERLAKYRAAGLDVSVMVQRGVLDRMLGEQLVLMRERDRG